ATPPRHARSRRSTSTRGACSPRSSTRRSRAMPERRRGDASSLRIVVLGYVVRGPLGGMVWSNLQYLVGLARLGHEVFFVEDSDDYPACYDPERGLTDDDPRYGLGFAARVFRRIGHGERWAYHDAHRGRWQGPGASRALEVCRDAALLLDLCGVNPLRAWVERIPVRVLVDEDPAFTQIRHLRDPAARARAQAHTAFFSFGANVGKRGCAIPDDGLEWRPTRQPVALDGRAPRRRPGTAAAGAPLHHREAVGELPPAGVAGPPLRHEVGLLRPLPRPARRGRPRLRARGRRTCGAARAPARARLARARPGAD